jgi:hypothetical protein
VTTPVAYGSATADPGVGPQPNNAIVVDGQPDVQYLNLETATNCYPGRLVTKGTHDNDVAVCGAGGVPVGVLGYEQASKKDRPATRATIYLVDAQVPVLKRGKGATVMLYLSADAATIVKGDKLVCAAAGCVTKATAAKFATSTAAAVLGGTASPTIVGSIPTEGLPVATAEESATVVDVGGWIMATLER